MIESLTPDSPGFIPRVALVEVVLAGCFELEQSQLIAALAGKGCGKTWVH